MAAGSTVPEPHRRITHELMAATVGSFEATVEATEPGVVAGLEHIRPRELTEPVGTWTPLAGEGDHVDAGTAILHVAGSAIEVMLASDHAVAVLGFAGGVAARALSLKAAAPEGLEIVCGGWKKLPVALKPALRAGLGVAGLGHRLVEGPFVYVDKNAVALLGGVGPAVARGLALGHGPVSVQVVDVAGAREAAAAGAAIVMVDTGSIDDLRLVDAALREAGCRSRMTLAFAGGVGAGQLREVRAAGADVVDVGRAVLDAPLWDLRFRVS